MRASAVILILGTTASCSNRASATSSDEHEFRDGACVADSSWRSAGDGTSLLQKFLSKAGVKYIDAKKTTVEAEGNRSSKILFFSFAKAITKAQPPLENDHRWPKPGFPLGNLLMNYWDNRGAALLDGSRFLCEDHGDSNPIVRGLPCDVKAQPEAVVENWHEQYPGCGGYGSHECMDTGSWQALGRNRIASEMQHALKRAGMKPAVHHFLHQMHAGHAVGLHLRCKDSDFQSNPDEYGVLPGSYYQRVFDSIEPAELHSVVVFQAPLSETETKCKAATDMVLDVLRKRMPAEGRVLDFNEQIKLHPPPDALARDMAAFTWATMTQMRKLVLPLSSFSLSAAIASKGEVYAPAAQGGAINVADDNFAKMGPGWHWIRTKFIRGGEVTSHSLDVLRSSFFET